MQIDISDQLALVQIEKKHSDELFKLTDRNRTYLKQWLPWLDFIVTEDDTYAFIERAIKLNEDSRCITFVIRFQDKISGIIGFNPIDRTNKIGEIGYWLSEECQGHGIITRACKFLINIGFDEFGLNRIQIPAAEQNVKSRSVPERLGFTFEGIIRDKELLYSKYVNHAMYSLLRREYK